MRDGNGETISPPPTSDRRQLTPLQRRLVAGVAVGAAVIALIGFVGSYAAVAELAERKGFGRFARVFPIGLDAGILVLLALDLLLTWLRMPLPLLRQIAWLLTAATIAFNSAVAWPDPIGVGMHATIPVLFVAVVEAARHAIGTAADISAARHMESVRLARWLLSPVRTFLLWRRMKLWELRSYEQVVALEQQRMIERARLRAKYGRRWRRKAPVESVLALRLMRYGRPLGPVEGVLDVEVAPAAPAAPVEQPAVAPALQGAPALPAPAPAAPIEGAPERPALASEGAPLDTAPSAEGAPERPAVDDQGAAEGDAPTVEGAPQRPEVEPAGQDDDTAEAGDEQRPPTRAEVKNEITALYAELNGRPGEGAIVKLLEAAARQGYPYTSRRHAQKLRDEIETADPKLLERYAGGNVRALTG
ncbi:DUF2637 domain-containing protein [Streptomyces sp. NPDC059544]|uniref:DUF2637 domain-containing protein n=1 Tax=Streptomyces sp. NPDC059544 TaxID=3346861 RepID=UPI003698C93B